MSREERIISKLEGTYDFIEFVNDNYPEVLIKWNNRSGLVNHTNSTNADINNPKDQSGVAYTSG